MSSPELNPFVEANACSTCPSNQFATTSHNDDLSCCATVVDGTCTACTSADASGCTAVTCATNKFNNNDNAADGCEAVYACATVTGGTCTACTTADASRCTAVTCNAGTVNADNDATNGCEVDSVPNGDGSSSVFGTGLRKVVSDWIAGGTLKDAVVAKYGEIENWSTSEVTNLAYVFYGKSSFNADISKWVVSSVTNLQQSKSFLAKC